MKNPFGRLGLATLEMLFPSQCFGCDRYGGFLCAQCEASLLMLKRPYCGRCAAPIPSGELCQQCTIGAPEIDESRSPYLLEGAIREAIHGLKYRNLRAVAPTLGRLLAQWLGSSYILGESLVPVPLHPRRLRGRGYNQSALLAKEVSKHTGLGLNEDVLVRTRDSPPQVSLSSREERARNVEGSFECVGDARGRRFILVDDVVTTGSTMSACAAALKAGGARSVWGLSLTRQQPNFR